MAAETDSVQGSGPIQETEDQVPGDVASQVKLWNERVSLGKQALDDYFQKEGLTRVYDEYNGKFDLFFNGLKGQIPVPPINEVFAYVDTDIANTYNRDPKMAVNPKAGTVLGAKLWEMILAHDWRKLKVKEEVEPEIMDKNLAGFAWHKVGWDVESAGAEEELKITKENLYSCRVEPKDLVFNLGSKKAPRDCMWMAQRIVKPLKFVRQKYKNARGRWPLKGVPNPEMDKTKYENANFKDDISVAVLWEIWDADTRQVFLIAEGLKDKFLADPRPWPDYMEEFPFIFYWDLYAPGKPRPKSSILTWEPQLLEKMVLMASIINHQKRWSRQMLVRSGAISETDLDKLERADDGAIISYTGTGKLDENLKMLDWGAVQPDFYMTIDRMSATIRDVNGQPEFERGGVTKTSTRTEGELQMIAQGAKGRTDRRQDRFETHLENIARHMLMHRQANFDFAETIKITGELPENIAQALGKNFDPVNMTLHINPKDIAGEYEVEIKAGSTLPLNTETKTSIIQNLIQSLANVDAGASPLIQALVSELLDQFDMKSLQEAFAGEQQQAAQAAQAQQQQGDANEIKARSQAAVNVAKADKVGAEADALHLALPQSAAGPESAVESPQGPAQ